MAVLHSRGLVNSDLKPDNVLLRQPHDASTGACPEVVITDFGSAFSQTETDISRLVFEMQTLPYRAPEVRHLTDLLMEWQNSAGGILWNSFCRQIRILFSGPLQSVARYRMHDNTTCIFSSDKTSSLQ